MKTKIIIKADINFEEDRNKIAKELKKFIKKGKILILPTTWELEIVDEKTVIELQEHVDEIYVYKVKEVKSNENDNDSEH